MLLKLFNQRNKQENAFYYEKDRVGIIGKTASILLTARILSFFLIGFFYSLEKG
jgi:hypothetical protein